MAVTKSRTLRSILIAIATLVLIVVGFVASVIVPFLSYAPVQNGTRLPDGSVLVSNGTSNVYVVPGRQSRVLLVDCGIDPKMEAVSDILRPMGLTLKNVEAVVLTHAHTDHVEGCAAVPNAQFYALDREVAALEGREVVPGFVSKVTFAKPKPTGLKVIGLADGQIAQIGNLTVTAYGLPGHTPGSAAFLVNNILYLGDTAGITTDGKTAPAPWIFNTDGRQSQVSLKALADRLRRGGVKIDTVATGHSAPGPFSALP